MGIRNNNVKDPYRALNLSHDAGGEVIKRSYRQLAKKYHPDTWSAPCFSELEKQNATVVFQKVSAAYELLTDSDKKADYDRNYKLGVYKDNDDDDDRAPPRRTADPQVQPPRTGAPPPLPRGWTTAKDPTSGNMYYCHISGRSSWDHPSLSNSNNVRFTNSTNTTNNSNNTQSNTSSGTKSNYNNNNSNPNRQSGGKTRPPTFGKRGPAMHEDGYYSAYDDHINRTTRKVLTRDKPENHRCGAFLALWLCPPFGILAVYHSMKVDWCWRKKEEEKRQQAASDKDQADLAENHSNRAGSHACFGNSIGILFWVYMLFRNGNFELPEEWDMPDWWPGDNGP